MYVDVGLGKNIDTQLPSASYIQTDFPNLPLVASALSLMQPNDPTLFNNLALEAGFLWKNPYRVDSPYFPFISLGLRYQYSNFDPKTTLMEFNLIGKSKSGEEESIIPKLTTHYEFLQSSLLANLKMDLYRWGSIMPYVNLGLGASWNQSKQQAPFFSEENPKFVKLTSPSSQVSSFSYQVGAGVDCLVTENFWLSLGYNYNNFGRIEVAKFSVSSNDSNFIKLFKNFNLQPFNFRNLTTHTIQLTGRYVFG